VDDVVMVEIPVSRDAAAELDDERRRAVVGRLVSSLLRPSASDDPLALLIAEVKSEARRDGLTDAEIDAELATYNAENRVLMRVLLSVRC
jgi:hypothetical protein